MKKSDTIPFQSSLTAWYNQFKRDLPWRLNKNPYHVWLSEIMLQQTQVKTVIPYYNRFLEKWPTIDALANADTHDLMKAWEGLGYYTRIHNLHKAAKIVQTQHNGVIPSTPESFQALSGVGDYTMSAVLSIVHNLPLAVVDGNVKRVLARLYSLETPINQPSGLKTFKKYADALLDVNNSGIYNQALMELGALICSPKSPKCDICPVQKFCTVFQSKTVLDYPKRLKTPPSPTYHVAVGVIVKGDKLLITQRKKGALLGGMWEFPGGKIEKDETPESACIREIMEEVDLKVEVKKKLKTIRHAYTHFKIVMDVFICKYIYGDVKLSSPTDYRWISPDEIPTYPFPGANHKFIPDLIQYLA